MLAEQQCSVVSLVVIYGVGARKIEQLPFVNFVILILLAVTVRVVESLHLL
jgi:hypothetical protein